MPAELTTEDVLAIASYRLSGFSKEKLRDVWFALRYIIEDHIADGEGEVRTDLGTFKTRMIKAREITSNIDGRKVKVPEHRVPVLKFSKEVKDLVNT